MADTKLASGKDRESSGRSKSEVEVKKQNLRNTYNISFEIRITSFILSMVSMLSLFYLEYINYHANFHKDLYNANSAVLKQRSTIASKLHGFTVISIAWVSLLWSGPMTIVAGLYMYPGSFKVWQPFQGGDGYVFRQAFGWLFFSVAFASTLFVMLNFQRFHGDYQRGIMGALAIMSMASHVLLNSSLDEFDPTDKVQSKSLFDTLARKEVFFIVLTHLTTFCWSIHEDIVYHLIQQKNKILSGIFVLQLCCVLLTQYIEGFRKHGGFSLYRPFQGGTFFILMQAIGWTLLGFYCYLIQIHWNKDTPNCRGIPSVLGSVSFASNLVLLVSLQHYKTSLKINSMKGFSIVHRSLRTTYLLPAFSGLMLFLIVLQNSVGEIVSLEDIKVFLLLISFALSAPTMHYIGFIYVEGYTLWQPFEGGVSFVCLQGIGWFVYALMLLALMNISHSLDIFQSIQHIAPLGFISQLSILHSLFEFSNSKMNGIAERLDRSSYFGRSIESTRTIGYISARVLSFCMAVASFSMSALLDLSSGVVQRFSGIGISALLSCLAVSLLQYSCMKVNPNLSLLQPFQGTPHFIVTQAIGWTTFAISLLGQLILAFGCRNQFNLDPTHSIFGFGWTFITGIAQAFAYFCLRSGVLDISQKKTTREVIKRKSEKNLDMEELESLLKSVKRSNVQSILKKCICELEAKDENESEIHLSKRSLLLGSCAIVLAHASLISFIYADLDSFDSPFDSHHGVAVSTSLALVGVGLIQGVLGPIMHNKHQIFRGHIRFKVIQPFQGGFRFVVLQSLAWTLFAVALGTSLISANYELQFLASKGIMSAIGLIFYTSQVLLLWSLGQFSAKQEDQLHFDWQFSYTEDSTMLMLSLALMMVFVSMDIAIIRFGLTVRLAFILKICGLPALFVSVPLSIWLRRRTLAAATKGSVIFLSLGCVLWSFTVLLGLLLLTNFAFVINERLWLSSTAAAVNVVSHALVVLSSVTNKRAIFLVPVISIATGFLLILFTWTILPSIRAFLDWPMHFYAQVAKRWKGWLSPDGHQAFEGVHIRRSIPYYNKNHKDQSSRLHQMLDIMTPLKCNLSIKRLGHFPPLIYFHGGGHICVHREILHHSVTPFVRAGMTVYSVDYPLSPEVRFPHAVLCGLRAVKWVSDMHCAKQCIDEVDEDLSMHECKKTCTSSFYQGSFCAFCQTRLGVSNVQLIGDSAGGNLASMVTALIHNDSLREKLIESVNSDGSYDDLLNATFPKVDRLVSIYGLLGRQTLLENVEKRKEKCSFAFNALQYLGVKFIFKLYDPPKWESPLSTITDLGKDDLKEYAQETLILCGREDPLIYCNKIAALHLETLGFNVCFKEYPGTHGFHGFPVLWMRYLNSDWTKNALPATEHMLEFLTGSKWNKQQHSINLQKLEIIPDRSPFIVFPLLLGVPLMLAVSLFWI